MGQLAGPESRVPCLEGTEMLSEEVERCSEHPEIEPVMVTVNVIRSAQADHPTRLVREPRCPRCP